ncbi:helix-turn-helix transcriptional regulator [Paludicola sp. MB14-C6]|uniref:helix-turn-helix domain-containing protein n=1 Tax=Paludihabitans sp. MB14-C6 TaxID=3070656 RepID=UPI0027DE4984|nr:helix-turn-helix transcriptional regulator [Paludicola sp. MB14-C6]WMJ24342.1 helix-turn-helix transcriptional regulator [Paludicola sp. MB14-C6]
MMFSEKLKQLRKSAKMLQTELAKALGVTTRTVQYYEAGERYPQTAQITNKICEIFQVSNTYLMSEQDEFVKEATEKYGTSGKNKANAIIAETSGLFAGGELDEEDRDLFFKAITDIYFQSKERAKKYASK